MTHREREICRAILDYLHTLEGGQATDTLIHQKAFADFDPAPSVQELDAALAEVNARRWTLGVPAKFDPRRMKWSLTDAGEAARLELRE